MQRSVAIAGPAARLADYLELAKPRITFMVLVSAAAGYYLGVDGPVSLVELLHAMLGTALVAAARAA
jgi:protoheme IX farnesyltransferase